MANQIAVLKQYFGYRPNEGIKEFGAEVKALSMDEKRELAELAAKELGVSLDN